MKAYGINKVLYEVEVVEGILRIHVKTKNKSFRKTLQLHQNDSQWLLNHYKEINNKNPKAMYWFFELLNDNRKYFIDKKVKLIF
jgi:hypothetical protein